jgi:hypothetical protein
MMFSMNAVFKSNDSVEALDTRTGKWLAAKVTHVSELTISVKYDGFSSKKNKSTEHIPLGLVQSKWPVRKPTVSCFDIPTSRRRVKTGQQPLGYNPINKCLNDKVFCILKCVCF